MPVSAPFENSLFYIISSISYKIYGNFCKNVLNIYKAENKPIFKVFPLSGSISPYLILCLNCTKIVPGLDFFQNTGILVRLKRPEIKAFRKSIRVFETFHT